MANKDKGQSLVEVVFSVVIIVLFLTGAVIALLMSVSARSQGLARKKATRLAETVMENLINDKTNNPAIFWQLNEVSSQTMSSFNNYTYSIGFSLSSASPSCNIGVTDCVEATVGVSWTDKKDNYLEVKRFFSKNF
ncbi:MAG: hypothetical protein WCV93_03445 [Candidatus Shapirobacteria bacterium]|jgi:Tfp pilus assembly protein PilV